MLTLTAIRKTFTTQQGRVPVLHDVSLATAEGELVVLLGASGSGKSTLLRLVAGLLSPDSGDILFNGQSVLGIPTEKRGAVMVFQENQLFPYMTLAENIAFGLKIQRRSRQAIRAGIQEALARVQLTGYEKRYPAELSSGQRQRAALARALAVAPRMLLLDEPLSNLDPTLRDELRREIVRLQKQSGITSLFVTHDQTEAVLVADRIALLLHGKIAQVGIPRDFYDCPATAEIARFFGAVNLIPARKRGAILETPFGQLTHPTSRLPDGQVLAMVRPEAIQIGANGANTLTGRVQSWMYQGAQSQGMVVVGDTPLELRCPPYFYYQPGDSLTFHFKHIWLMPIEERVP